MDALDAGLTGRCDLQGALAGYEQRRNEASIDDYRENLSAARFIRPAEDLYCIRWAIRGNQHAKTALQS